MLVADDDGTGRHRLEETARHDARTDVRLGGEHQARAGIGDLADDRAAVEGQRAMVALVAVPQLDAADLRRPVDIQHALLVEFTQDGVVPRRLVGQLLPVDAAIKDAVFVVQPGGNDRVGKRMVQQRHVRGDKVSPRGTHELLDLGRAGVGVDVVRHLVRPMPIKAPVEVELRWIPHRRYRDGVVGLRCLVVEVDDEVDVLACHPLPRRSDDMAKFVEFDHPHADEFGGGADPFHALVLGTGLLRPHADHGDRAFDPV